MVSYINEGMKENRIVRRIFVPKRNGKEEIISFTMRNFIVCTVHLIYAIMKVQKTNLGLDMNDTHQKLFYEDGVNLIGDDTRRERNAGILLNACKDICLAVNTGKTKYMEI